MPNADFFEKFGLFAVKNFLDRDFCCDLVQELKTAPKRKGTFVKPHTDVEVVDESVKKRDEITKLAPLFDQKVRERLISIKEELSSHYEIELAEIQSPKYSVYKKDDFYGVHRDSDQAEDALDFLKERKVSSIIFLNEESVIEKKGCYSGGNLTFHGLMENEAFGKFGLPLVSEPGMLITFLPTTLHEVTPVTSGERYTIASWFI